MMSTLFVDESCLNNVKMSAFSVEEHCPVVVVM